MLSNLTVTCSQWVRANICRLSRSRQNLIMSVQTMHSLVPSKQYPIRLNLARFLCWSTNSLVQYCRLTWIDRLNFSYSNRTPYPTWRFQFNYSNCTCRANKHARKRKRLIVICPLPSEPNPHHSFLAVRGRGKLYYRRRRQNKQFVSRRRVTDVHASSLSSLAYFYLQINI